MNVLLLLSFAASVCLCICDLDPNKLRVFPAPGHNVAGVFQVSYVNSLNQSYYAFNASEARSVCESLGVNIASISQVVMALARGLETCRFGWTDEHLAVVPRVTAQVNCGQNRTGLVRWRAPITKKFDVFCVSESDTDTEPLPTVPHTFSLSSATLQPSVSSEFSQSNVFTHEDSKAEKALRVGSTQGSSGKKTVVITSVVAVFLVAIVAVVYIKVKRNSDKEPYIEREEWTHVKYENKKSCPTKVDSV